MRSDRRDRRKRLHQELYLSPVEATSILEAAEKLGVDWFVPLYLARYTGLRVVELVHIRVRDIRFDLGKLFVWTAKSQSATELVGCNCGGYMNHRGIRDTVPFKSVVGQVLSGWIEVRSLATHDWLFPSRKNHRRHTTMRRMKQIFDEASLRAGVPKIPQRGIHSFRHLVGTEVADMTGDPYKVQAFLRHESVASSEAYVHVQGLEKIAERLGS